MAAKLTQCQQNAIRLHASLFEAGESLRALPVTPLTYANANGFPAGSASSASASASSTSSALPRGSIITSLDYHPDESPSGITSKLKGTSLSLSLPPVLCSLGLCLCLCLCLCPCPCPCLCLCLCLC